VTRFVFPSPSSDALSRWRESLKRAKKYIEESKAVWVEYDNEQI
jgi:hypothetical protein